MESAENDDESVQTVEIIKQPGQTLGFYIREGNGINRSNGVFISRIASGSVVAKNGLLRVNDEILSVNSVDVTHMSLDDVVILMSIAKCLVLTVRFQKPHSVNAIVSGAEEQEDSRRQRPVVVLKSGFANSFSGLTIEDRSPDDLVLSERSRGWSEERGVSSSHQAFASSRNDGKFGRSVDSSRERLSSPYFQPKISNDPQQSRFGISERVAGGPPCMVYQNPPRSAHESYVIDTEHELNVGERAMRSGNSSYSNDYVYGPPRSCQRHVDYASDTDVTYHANQTPFEQVMSRCNPYKTGSLNSGRGLRSHVPQLHNSARDSNSSTGYNGNLSNEQYSSDSELVTHYYRSSRGARVSSSRPSAGQPGLHQMEGSEIFYSLPHKSRGSFKHGAFSPQRDISNRASVGPPRSTGSYADVQSVYCSEVASAPKNKMLITTSSDDYAAWLDQRSVPVPVNASVSPRGGSFGNNSLSRKMSMDSLSDAKIYRMDDPGNNHRYDEPRHLQEDALVPDLQRCVLENYVSRSCTPMSTMTLSRAQQSFGKGSTMNMIMSSASLSSSEGSRSKGIQLTRVPLKIQPETFLLCPSGEGVTFPDGTAGLSGLLYVHVFCGHGLKSSRTALRDLYCVIEVNGINKARTMIRTGAINFDWDEEFELDIEDAKSLMFLVYSWDPHRRHTLCFNGSLSLVTAVRQTKYQRIALKLEPKGTLYVELNYTESAVALLRRPSVHRNGVFGIDLKTLVHRENAGYGIPLVVIRCIEEVERRGLDQIGLYRLCGSARRKTQLKEEIERNVLSADLSVDAVTDVNVITSVLKDFLRELPEPLCSNGLYQMLIDALSVQVPGDHEGNTQLMLGILECLPKINQETLSYILNHLKRVALKSDVNKMTTKNLAICLGPALICPSTENDRRNSLPQTMNCDKQIELLKYLLDIWTGHQAVLKTPNNMRRPIGSSSRSSLKMSTSSGISSAPERTMGDGSGDQRPNRHQEQGDGAAWENTEISSC